MVKEMQVPRGSKPVGSRHLADVLAVQGKGFVVSQELTGR